jgi:hypothetical protein
VDIFGEPKEEEINFFSQQKKENRGTYIIGFRKNWYERR